MIDHLNNAVWEDFFKYVRPDVHGCPVAMVKEFCQCLTNKD
jgi:hypothetical protein